MLSLTIFHSSLRCAQAGITRLFADDPTGFLKQHATGLRAHLARSAELVVGFDGEVVEGEEEVVPPSSSSTPLCTVDTNAARAPGGEATSTSGSAKTAAAANGRGGGGESATRHAPSIRIHLLSARDAEETMAKAVAAVARAEEEVDTPSTSGARSATDAAVARYEAALATASGPAALAEPGVALVYGSAFTLAGYPPWALRAAEIYSMGRLRDADGRGVRGALARYGKTVQRFGA